MYKERLDEYVWSARYLHNMYVYRITFNLFRCKRKDRFTWHCRCPCYFNFFLQLFVEDIFSKKRPCQLEWPLLFVYMYVCVDLLSLCLYDEDDDESNSIEWRERSRERERIKICSVSFLYLTNIRWEK
jgi:hypothetical protein